MRFTVQRPDLRKGLKGTEEQIATSATLAVREAGQGLLEDYRGDVIGAGLGRKLSNTWRLRHYPQAGNSLDPTAFIFSKAPKLIDAYSRGATILPTDGRRYLAIPTDNVPMKGRGRRMTPLDVEVSFNQDLIVRPGRNGRKLAYVNVTPAKNRKGWRRPTKGRVAQGRTAKLVLMFVLVPSVTVRRRLDIQSPAQRAANQIPALLQKHWR